MCQLVPVRGDAPGATPSFLRVMLFRVRAAAPRSPLGLEGRCVSERAMVNLDHNACVSRWMERAAKGLQPEPFVDAFDKGFAALWRRAHQTLGDVTLMAIVDRVLHNAVEVYPVLSTLSVDSNGLQCDELRKRAASSNDQHALEEGGRYVMVEFLRVLGNLTADILTRSLHAELDKLGGAEQRLDEQPSQGSTRAATRKNGGDATS